MRGPGSQGKRLEVSLCSSRTCFKCIRLWLRASRLWARFKSDDIVCHVGWKGLQLIERHRAVLDHWHLPVVVERVFRRRERRSDGIRTDIDVHLHQRQLVDSVRKHVTVR